MNYALGVAIPVLIQCLAVLIVIDMNTGNGSWLGLLAFLLGMFTIPGTALVNFIYIRTQQKSLAQRTLLLRCCLIALVAPMFILSLLLF